MSGVWSSWQLQPGDSAGVGTDTGMKSSDRTENSYSDKNGEYKVEGKKFEGLLKKHLIVLEDTYFKSIICV